MASIRVRLTAWNGGVLLVLLLIVVVASYVFLRFATLAQVDRALDQQLRLLTLTAREPGKDGGVRRTSDFITDLEADALVVSVPPNIPDAFVTAPARVAREDTPRAVAPSGRGGQPAHPEIDWADLRARLGAVRDSGAAFSVRGPHGGSRVLAQRVLVGARPVLLIATQPLHETIELLETARVAALIAVPIAVLLAVVLGNALARRALDPVASMAAEARRIGARNLHERLSVRNANDELGRLAGAFNDVLERVDRALEQQRRFTADASHELRTPIALIRAEADVALAGHPGNQEEYHAALSVIRDGSQQLSRIVNDLFLLARADAGQTLVTRARTQLDELVSATTGAMRSLAARNGLELHVHTAPPPAEYDGDEELLRRALRNLLDNAIKYSTDGGRIDVALTRDAAAYRLSVTDTGPGIPPEDQSHIFERFYRGDRARGHRESAAGAGAGLGLAIAREIAELHGGRVELRRSDARGSCFELVLPTSPRGQQAAVDPLGAGAAYPD